MILLGDAPKGPAAPGTLAGPAPRSLRDLGAFGQKSRVWGLGFRGLGFRALGVWGLGLEERSRALVKWFSSLGSLRRNA